MYGPSRKRVKFGRADSIAVEVEGGSVIVRKIDGPLGHVRVDVEADGKRFAGDPETWADVYVGGKRIREGVEGAVVALRRKKEGR